MSLAEQSDRRAAGTFESTAPATGAVVGVFPVHGPDDVRAAVSRARVAATAWADLGFDGRRQRLAAYRGYLARRVHELADLVHRENGKPHADAIFEITLTVDHLAWAATHARKVLGLRRVGPGLLAANHAAWREYQPLGVVGVIGPWNYPVFTPMGSIAYALAAGNAVVFKPSEHTPAVGTWLADAWRAAVPDVPDALQVVTGLGETGAALCCAGVDKLAFTGSAPTGRRVMAACAETLTPVLLELGGKDAMIVDADAVREETFGPTIVVSRVADAEEGLRQANASVHGLAGAVFSRSRTRALDLARRMKSGMTSVNSVLTFASVPALPFGGVGESGFGRIHGEDGLREFTRAKAITRQRVALPVNLMSFGRPVKAADTLARVMGLVHGRHR